MANVIVFADKQTDKRTDGQMFKGGYLDFSHLTELENIYTTEIYK